MNSRTTLIVAGVIALLLVITLPLYNNPALKDEQTPTKNESVSDKHNVEVAAPAPAQQHDNSRVLASSLWTCTWRSNSQYDGTASVSCTGSEKVITGGCENAGPSAYNGVPTSQGWYCPAKSGYTTTAYAQCCY